MIKINEEMQVIFKRVGDWNALRYSRKYNQQLTSKLLNEEHQEYFDAATQVDKLDALCDTCYVAMGGLWKIGVDNVFVHNDADLFGNALCEDKSNIITLKAIIAKVVVLAQTELNISPQTFIRALSIVCDANDSKIVPQSLVASNVKANINKGTSFVPPETELSKLLAEEL